MIRITDVPGIVGDYTTDCQPAFQELIAHCPNGTRFFVPAGRYHMARPLDFTSLGNWSMAGEGGQNSILVSHGADSGPVAKSVRNIFSVQDMAFIGNSTTGGTGFYSENTQSCAFTNVRFAGGMGMDARDPFLCNWHHCQFNGRNGRLQNNGSKVGLQIHQATACSITGSCDFTGWDEGLRASGAVVSIQAARFEVNGVGMRLGCEPRGFPHALTRSNFSGISMEANDTAIRLQVCGGCTFNSVGGLGSTNSPSGQSKYGVDYQTGSDNVFQCVAFSGAFEKTALFLRDSDENQRVLFQACKMANDYMRPEGDDTRPYKVFWDKPSMQLCLQRKTFFQACNETP